MRKVCIVLLALALLAWAANVKLYLTDGTYHLVREYQVQADRVRFYSVERSEWEEIPLEMVDLKRKVITQPTPMIRNSVSMHISVARPHQSGKLSADSQSLMRDVRLWFPSNRSSVLELRLPGR